MRAALSVPCVRSLAWSTTLNLSPALTLPGIVAYPMQNYRDLKEAAIEGYLLPTALVQKLIGVTPRGEEFDRLGFRFVRSDRRTEWSVSISPRATHPE